MAVPQQNTEQQIVLLGDVRYAVHRNWAEWPDHIGQGFLSEIAVGSDDRIYALQRGATPVVVFNPDGSFAEAWGDDLIADGHGIWATQDGRLFIVDRDAHQVIVTDLSGTPLKRLGTRHQPANNAPFNHPTHASEAPDGEIYVSDGYGGTNVHRFSEGGELLATWGADGSGAGEFSTPHATWALADRVLVGDRENNRVQVFDRDGGHMMDWTGLYHPMAIYVDADGFAYVSDQTPRIIKYAPDGTIVGRCRGSINGAHGLYGNRRGDLFMAELPPAGLSKLERL
jgi:hypothetical protein